MKRYIIFSISFITLFVLFQMVSGYILTLWYTPDMTNAWKQVGHLSSNVVIEGKSTLLSLLLAFLAATIAYFSSELLVKDKRK